MALTVSLPESKSIFLIQVEQALFAFPEAGLLPGFSFLAILCPPSLTYIKIVADIVQVWDTQMRNKEWKIKSNSTTYRMTLSKLGKFSVFPFHHLQNGDMCTSSSKCGLKMKQFIANIILEFIIPSI